MKINFLKCPNCGSSLIWGGDFDAEDCGEYEKGIISNFNCNCGVYTEVFHPLEKEANKWIKHYLIKPEDL